MCRMSCKKNVEMRDPSTMHGTAITHFCVAQRQCVNYGLSMSFQSHIPSSEDRTGLHVATKYFKLNSSIYRSQWLHSLKHGSTATRWDCGFESHQGHGCLSVSYESCECCQAEASAMGWSHVWKIVLMRMIEEPPRGLGPLGLLSQEKKKSIQKNLFIQCNSLRVTKRPEGLCFVVLYVTMLLVQDFQEIPN